MNRFNFAQCSGVILDACKPHGLWFDPDELRLIVAFIQGGGMDVARTKERRRLELERRHRAQYKDDVARYPGGFQPPVPDSIASARSLLSFLLGDR